MTEQTEMWTPFSYTVEGSFTTDGLADSFAEIEKHDVRVSRVQMHPSVWEDHFASIGTEVFDMDSNGLPDTIWGARVVLSEAIPEFFVGITGASDNKIVDVRLMNTGNDPRPVPGQEARGRAQDQVSTVPELVNIIESRGNIQELLDELRQRGHLES